MFSDGHFQFFVMISTRVLLLLAVISCAYGHKKFKKDKEQHDHNVGIIGGHEISIKQAPFMVSVRLNGSFHWCGGSIIHKRFVLTAAQCVVPKMGLKVLVGTDTIDEGGKLYDVEKIIVHENYSNITNDYDVCLLKLNESLTFGPTVGKVLLNRNETLVKRGKWLNVTGWGYTQTHDEHSVSRYLQQVEVPIISMPKCQLHYKHSNLTHRMMCAGGVGKDACTGDIGGPLTWKNKQIGIVSFKNTGCGKIPRIYTKIRIVNPWIRDMIKHHHHKKENQSQKTKKEKRQELNREMSQITKKLFKRALQ